MISLTTSVTHRVKCSGELAVPHRHAVDTCVVAISLDLHPLFLMPIPAVDDPPGVIAVIGDLFNVPRSCVLHVGRVAVERLLIAGWHLKRHGDSILQRSYVRLVNNDKGNVGVAG